MLMAETVVRARLFPDYGEGTPIWLPRRRLAWHDLEVNGSLKSRLMNWADEYENGTSGMTEDEFVAEGYELARLLSEELGWEVVYEE